MKEHIAPGETVTAEETKKPVAEAFSFGDPIPVLDRRELLDLSLIHIYFASVGGGTFHPDAKTLCFHCHEPCSVRKNLLEPYGCGDGGSETMRGICTDNHTNRRRGKPSFKAVGLCHEHHTDTRRSRSPSAGHAAVPVSYTHLFLTA